MVPAQIYRHSTSNGIQASLKAEFQQLEFTL
jgi:hypothetical protein